MTVQELKHVFASGSNVHIMKTMVTEEKTVIIDVYKGKFRFLSDSSILCHDILIVENHTMSSLDNFRSELVIYLK